MSNSESYRILVVDDEEKMRDLLAKYLSLEGHAVQTAPDGETARETLSTSEIDLLITDIRMPGMGGLGLLEWVQEKGPSIPSIVISAYGDVQDAVAAMRYGASDYLVKPFEADELVLRIARVMQTRRMETRLRALVSTRHENDASEGFLESRVPAMRAVYEMARKAAPSNAAILIDGESGTGKEVLAKWIHRMSARADKDFVPINLGGIPENLLESELFGHEKGAFTGADRRKIGMFEVASGGTLFLDEIGEMGPQVQVKLLRVLQDRRIQRLGSTVSFPIDIRLIAATNRDLGRAVKDGLFREDLLYRLNVIPLHLPPLRERKADIPSLVKFMLARRGKAGISEDALAELQDYAFPGNIRELDNLLERALILRDGPVLRASDFGIRENDREPRQKAIASGDDARFPPSGRLADLEKWAILRALERNEGKRGQTAEELGISRRTLLNKLTEYGLPE